MVDLIILAQLIVAASVLYVWIFRFHNVLLEFTSFGLNDLTRNFVGASKTILATLIIVGIWHQNLVLISASLMGGLIKRLPSLILLILCAFVASQSI